MKKYTECFESRGVREAEYFRGLILSVDHAFQKISGADHVSLCPCTIAYLLFADRLS